MKYRINWLFASLILVVACKSNEKTKDIGPKVMVNVEDLIKGEKPVRVDENGTEFYNEFQIASTVKLKRAFLVLEDGTRVPPDNMIDFTQGVILILQIDSGWAVKDNKVYLEGNMQGYDNANGNAKFLDMKMDDVLDKGVSIADANTIHLTVNKFKNVSGNVSITFGFKDRINGRYVGGAFRLYNSKK
jgi:hypothetical protein